MKELQQRVRWQIVTRRDNSSCACWRGNEKVLDGSWLLLCRLLLLVMHSHLVILVVGLYYAKRRRCSVRWFQRGKDDTRPIVPLNLHFLVRGDSRMIHDGATVVDGILRVVVVNHPASSDAVVVVGL